MLSSCLNGTYKLCIEMTWKEMKMKVKAKINVNQG